MKFPDGMIRQVFIRYYPDIAGGIVQGFSVYAVHDARRRRLEIQLEECNTRASLLATHDYLTGLPNRFLLTDRISTLLSQAEDNGGLVGLVVMNVNGFKRINSSYGLDGGDAVIREVARRMKCAINPSEALIRTSGDEFLLLVKEIHSPLEVNVAVDRILRDVQQPLSYREASLVPSLSFGIAFFPIDGTAPSELLAKADRMLDQARRSG
jgi:diguanylate cyclase (GGDEF)-like protein